MSGRKKRKSAEDTIQEGIEEASIEELPVWQNFTTESLDEFLSHQSDKQHEQQPEGLGSSRGSDEGGQETNPFIPEQVGNSSLTQAIYQGRSRQDVLDSFTDIGSIERIPDNSFRRHTAHRRASYGPSLTREEADRLIEYERSLSSTSSSSRIASFNRSLLPMPPPPPGPLSHRHSSDPLLLSSLPPSERGMGPEMRLPYEIPKDPQLPRIDAEMRFASLPDSSADRWLFQSRNSDLVPNQSFTTQHFNPNPKHQQRSQQIAVGTNDRQYATLSSRRRIEDNWTSLSARSSQIQNNGHGYVLPMAVESDVPALTPYQVMVRQSLEYFTAVDDDVNTTVQGRRKTILPNQLGIRCRFCGHIPVRGRARAAVYYPRSLMNLYQGAQNIASVHFQICTEYPAHLLEHLTKERPRKVLSKAGRRYWVKVCQEVGVYEDDNGLWYVPPHLQGNLKSEEACDRKPSSSSRP